MQHLQELVEAFGVSVKNKPEIMLTTGTLNEIFSKIGKDIPLSVEDTMDLLKILSPDGERVERVLRSLSASGGIDSDPFYLTLASWLMFRPEAAWVVLSLLANHAGLKVKMPADRDFGTTMSRILTPENGFEKSMFTPTNAARQLPTHDRESKNEENNVPNDWWLNEKWLAKNGFCETVHCTVRTYPVIVTIVSLDPNVKANLFVDKLLEKLFPNQRTIFQPLTFAFPRDSEDFPFELYDPIVHQSATTRITVVEARNPLQSSYSPVTFVVSPHYEIK